MLDKINSEKLIWCQFLATNQETA